MRHTKKLIAAGLVLSGSVALVLWRPAQTGWIPEKDCKPVWAECDTYQASSNYMRVGFRAYRCPDGFVAPAVTAKDGSPLFDIVGACSVGEEPAETDGDGISQLDFACVMPSPKNPAGCFRRIPERTGADGRTRPAYTRFAMAGEYFPKAESAGECIPSPCVLIAGIPFK